MFYSIKLHTIFNNYPRQAIIDVYNKDKVILYFPLTKNEEKHIPYFQNTNDILPFNRANLTEGSSLLPSPCQAGMFHIGKISNLTINHEQNLCSFKLELQEPMENNFPPILSGEIDAFTTARQNLSIHDLTQSKLIDERWHGEPAIIKFTSSNDENIQGLLNGSLQLVGNSKKPAFYIDWLMTRNNQVLIDNGFTSCENIQKQKLGRMFNHGINHENDEALPHQPENIEAYLSLTGNLCVKRKCDKFVAYNTEYQTAYFSEIDTLNIPNISPTINAQSLNHDGMPAQFTIETSQEEIPLGFLKSPLNLT